MSEITLAIFIFSGLCVFAIFMFWMERRAVARRKTDGTFIDVSDILLKGTGTIRTSTALKNTKAQNKNGRTDSMDKPT
ncbi:MAG: hypothetical protein OXC68_14510 [Aestuariivita sp.]|nr:hypothetical protein [Aestuariivita sp.]